MKLRAAISFVALVASAIGSFAPSAAAYRVEFIPGLPSGAPPPQITALNSKAIFGIVQFGPGIPDVAAFSWTDRDGYIQVPNTAGFTPYAANQRGDLGGIFITPTGNPHRPYVQQAAIKRPAGPLINLRPGGLNSGILSINQQVAAGYIEVALDSYRAAMWRADGTVVELGATLGTDYSLATAINARGQVVGRVYASVDASTVRAAWFTPGHDPVQIPVVNFDDPYQVSDATAINNRGDVVGWIGQPETNWSRPFIYRAATSEAIYPDFDFAMTAPYDQALLVDINNSGWAVGYVTRNNTGVSVPLLVSSEGDVITLPIPEGFDSAYPIRIADDGTIIGFVQVGLWGNAVRWVPD